MANLKEEYTDTKDRTHKVEHILSTEDETARERIVEELLQALTGTGKKILA